MDEVRNPVAVSSVPGFLPHSITLILVPGFFGSLASARPYYLLPYLIRSSTFDLARQNILHMIRLRTTYSDSGHVKTNLETKTAKNTRIQSATWNIPKTCKVARKLTEVTSGDSSLLENLIGN